MGIYNSQLLSSAEEVDEEVQKYIKSMLVLGDTEDGVKLAAEKFRSMLMETLREEKLDAIN